MLQTTRDLERVGREIRIKAERQKPTVFSRARIPLRLFPSLAGILESFEPVMGKLCLLRAGTEDVTFSANSSRKFNAPSRRNRESNVLRD